MMNNNYLVIMAGGIGSRFWPLSTSEYPKQFLDILGVGKSLLQITIERFSNICPIENVLIVTNESYKDIVKEQIPGLKENHLLLEPTRRNTAPCIAYANYVIQKSCPDANIIVAPSDHIILNQIEFENVILEGLEFISKSKSLLTLGIKPSRPDTGYGYIQADIENKIDNIFSVKTFTEKPNLETAKLFLESGEFSWNSGMFLWSLKTINDSFEKHLPDINNLFLKLNDGVSIEEVYSSCQNISIDYGIMEKSENVFVKEADFGWSDLGTWGSLYDNTPKDSSSNSLLGGKVVCYNSKNNVVHLPQDKTAILEGLDDYIIVDSGKSLLVCKKTEEQRIKQFVTDLNHA